MQIAIKRVNDWIALNDPSQHLDVSMLNLKTLPDIPITCQIFSCNNNNLTELPELPNCQILNCFHNKLTSLPQLPCCEWIECANNKLTSLPALPMCWCLNCAHNMLTSLPDLPKCDRLYCNDNRLTYLPIIMPCWDLRCANNEYLYISKRLAKEFSLYLKETPNYNKYARVIQRSYKKHLMKKYQQILNNYLFVGPSKIVCQYCI